MMNNQNKNVRKELLRKSIHLMGLIYIPIYLLTDRIIMLIFIFFLTLVAVFIEILKKRKKWIIWIFSREYERKGIGAHLYFCISIFIVTMFLSPQACFIGVICGAAGDGIAGIIRRIWTHGASISMFFISFILVVILNTKVDMIVPAAFISIILATIVEAKVRRIGKYYINDNFSVPLVAAFTYESFAALLNFL